MLCSFIDGLIDSSFTACELCLSGLVRGVLRGRQVDAGVTKQEEGKKYLRVSRVAVVWLESSQK